jgi:hypothetical protein
MYNASVVKIYNATKTYAGSIARFYSNDYFPFFKKALACYDPGIVVVNSEIVGLGPGPEAIMLQKSVSQLKHTNLTHWAGQFGQLG